MLLYALTVKYITAQIESLIKRQDGTAPSILAVSSERSYASCGGLNVNMRVALIGDIFTHSSYTVSRALMTPAAILSLVAAGVRGRSVLALPCTVAAGLMSWYSTTASSGTVRRTPRPWM